jgi:hypothetical protein
MTTKKDKLDYNSVDFGSILEYDESSSTWLRWKVKRAQRSPAGSSAGTFNTDSRTKQKSCSRVKIYDKSYLVHRIIWVLFYGSIDEDLVIDHIDGDPWNNNITNLRLTTTAINSRNSRIKTTNKTGVNGVSLRNTAGYLYYAAQYMSSTGNKQKVFSINKHGEDKAKQLAIDWRNARLLELEQSGVFYTERHGV